MPMKRRIAVPAIGAAALMACLAAGHAQPVQAPSEADTLERLKRGYLMCGYTAAVRRLMPSEVAICSDVAQALLEHGFGGDFDRLVVWWQAQRVHERIPSQTRWP